MTVEVVCACGQREVPQSDAVMLIWSHGARTTPAARSAAGTSAATPA